MAQQSKNNREIMVWNFWRTPISVRVRADKFVISDDYQKEIKSAYSRSKDEGSAELGVEGVGNISASGGYEEEKKSSAETESKKKINAYLNQANFAEIAPDTMCKFSVSGGYENYVSVLIDGNLKRDNWNTSDREIIIEFNSSQPDQVFITSHAVASLYKYIDNKKLFTPSYLISVKHTLSEFKKLYKFAKTTKVNGKPLLSDESVKRIARAVVDFRGVNLAVGGLLNAVSDVFFGKLVPQIYNEVNQKDPDKLKEDTKRLMALLYDVGKAAKDIGLAFNKIGGWYYKLNDELTNCKDEVLDRTNDDDGLQDQINALKAERDKWHNKYCNICNHMGWAIPVAYATTIFTFGLGVIAGSTTTAIMVKERDDAWAKREKAKEQLAKLEPNQKELKESFSKLTELSKSLTGIGDLCYFISSFFIVHSDRFLNFGKDKVDKADAMKQEWESWTTDKCISWVLGLNNGQFSKYENQIKSKFTEEEIDGEELPDLGSRFFKKKCKMDKTVADILVKEIESLKYKNDNAFQGFISGYDKDMEWIDTNKKDISDLARVLKSINVDFAFVEKGVIPSKWEPIELKSLGSDYVYSPTKEAQNLCK